MLNCYSSRENYVEKHRKILITGAAGFIGFHTALALKTRGFDVLGFDNFNTYYDPLLKLQRAQILKNASIQVIQGDLADKAQLEATIENFSPYLVVNLAAQAGVRYAKENPEAYFNSNLKGFFNLLEILKSHPQISLVYASSSSVYGREATIPFSLSQNTNQPNNLYAATKMCNELLAYSYHHLYGLDCTGLRYFTVYGPWGRPDMAYFSFTEAIEAGKKIQLYNFGEMERDFTYIDDIVEGTIAAIEKVKGFHIYNLGNNQPTQLETFVELLESFLGKKALIERVAVTKDEMLTTYADIEASQRDLGFQPKTSLDRGLQKFISWYKEWKLSGKCSVISEAIIQ
jgi:UDP-glucuronate 4-epimerase